MAPMGILKRVWSGLFDESKGCPCGIQEFQTCELCAFIPMEFFRLHSKKLILTNRPIQAVILLVRISKSGFPLVLACQPLWKLIFYNSITELS